MQKAFVRRRITLDVASSRPRNSFSPSYPTNFPSNLNWSTRLLFSILYRALNHAVTTNYSKHFSQSPRYYTKARFYRVTGKDEKLCWKNFVTCLAVKRKTEIRRIKIVILPITLWIGKNRITNVLEIFEIPRFPAGTVANKKRIKIRELITGLSGQLSDQSGVWAYGMSTFHCQLKGNNSREQL